MKIETNKVVTLEYTLKNASGEVLDTSRGDTPLQYLHGHGQIISGLEQALGGLSSGAELQVEISAAEAYGEYDPQKLLRVPRAQLPGEVEEGMVLEANTPDGGVLLLRVTEIHPEEVVLDANHPLAGQTLHFDVSILAVRSATEEEIAHGHVHGEGGHH